MIYMITIILSTLVAINFLLLKFSCNKTAKKKVSEKPFIIKKPSLKVQTAPTITTQHASGQLAATGS